MEHWLDIHKRQRKLTTLVENRAVYNVKNAELNIFETYEQAAKVQLIFDFPVITSMLSGKKIMHLTDEPSFEYFPGESVIMPKGKPMLIDFPIAEKNNPTQCLALGIDETKVKEVVYNFNNLVAIEEENNSWSLDESSSHLANNIELNQLLQRLMHTFLSNTKSKDILLDLMFQELIIRLLQTKAKNIFLQGKTNADTRIGFILNYIKENLTHKNITVEHLATKAYMSSSHFHKKFKNTFGVSPIDYVNSERVEFAKKLLIKNKDMKIADVAFKSGFNSISYFNRQFKKYEKITPSQYLKLIS